MGVRLPPLAPNRRGGIERRALAEARMKVEVVELSPVSLELAVELPAPEVDSALEHAYRALGDRAKIKGFRPGHVPRRILVQTFQDQVERDVASTLVRDSLPRAV